MTLCSHVGLCPLFVHLVVVFRTCITSALGQNASACSNELNERREAQKGQQYFRGLDRQMSYCFTGAGTGGTGVGRRGGGGETNPIFVMGARDIISHPQIFRCGTFFG